MPRSTLRPATTMRPMPSSRASSSSRTPPRPPAPTSMTLGRAWRSELLIGATSDVAARLRSRRVVIALGGGVLRGRHFVEHLGDAGDVALDEEGGALHVAA